MDGLLQSNQQVPKSRMSPQKSSPSTTHLAAKQNQVGTVILYGIPIVSLVIESQERLCLAQISNTLLKQYSYNEIHNRRVALGITCVQCTPVQLEILRRAGAMPVSSRRCGMITRREAERLCKSFLGDNAPPRLPDDFAFSVHHECAWGCRGAFLPSRYNSSRAKCIKCSFCGLFFSPNKFIFHSHRTSPNATYVQPDAANFNSWRRHMKLTGSPPDDIVHAWEDVKAMFNGGTRKRLLASSSGSATLNARPSITSQVQIPMAPTPAKQIKLDSPAPTPAPYSLSTATQLPIPPPSAGQNFPDLPLPISVMDYVWHNSVNIDGIKHFPFSPYALPWFGSTKRSVLGLSSLTPGSSQQESLLQHLRTSQHSGKLYHQSAFRPVFPTLERPEVLIPDDPVALKRQAETLELESKKVFAKDSERTAQNGYNLELGRDSENVQSDCVDKENELKCSDKDNGDSRPEIAGSDSQQKGTLKMILKKEVVTDTSNDSDDDHKGLSGRKTDPAELPELSRLISLKPKFRDDGLFKIREFSPNFLDAISNLKSEEKGLYSKLMAKRYYEMDRTKISELDYEREADYSRRMEDAEKLKSRYRPREDADAASDRNNMEEDEDDETVDIETTDDVTFANPAAKEQVSFHRLIAFLASG
ncbi:UNVERIFIED_CONTAM: hypothetical protein PYX00_008570 [Menopon gallinae]|uniref:c-SKI SMAD4-binding domain-containing protein n=1 Tax=Menopon gallinae TaxID=328185 RepID=A0AAW2HND8_9NEOP